MRVLVTGGYGFIGSVVAERFHKEGHEVYIIDDLSSGDKNNVEFKHKFFHLSVEDRNCEEVFRSSNFDVVVHLAAQIDVATSMENPMNDTHSNIVGLVNMLRLSAQSKVKKFIFSSSAAVYGNNENVPLLEETVCEPQSIYGLNKWLGENYCRKWTDMYGLDTLCLRFSNVYGPRQGRKGEGGVVSIFHDAVLSGKTLTVYGDGHQTRDFIYVSDVADAIYRASYSSVSGIYNLSTQTECSILQLIDVLRTKHPELKVKHVDVREGDIYRSCLDNRRIKRELDWVPLYNLEEGIHKTYEWFAARYQVAASVEKERKRKKDFKLPAWVKMVLPYIENVIAFTLVMFVTFLHQDNFQAGVFDYKIIYIILMGILYGSKQSMFSVILSSALFIQLNLLNGRELVSLLYDSEILFQVAVYLFFGLAVGYSTDRKLQIIASKDSQNQAQKEKLEFLNDVYQDTLSVKKDLQDQIVNNGDSLGKIYNIIKELESMEPEEIIHSTVSVLEKIMKSRSISIYTVKPNAHYYIRLLVKSNNAKLELQKSLKLADYPELLQVIETQKPFLNHKLNPELPMMVAPIISGGYTSSLVCIHEIEFEKLTLYYQNLFQICVDLISNSVSRAFQYVEATADQRYIEGTPILKPHIFQHMLDTKKEAKEKLNIDYVLLVVPVFGQPMDQIAQKIAGSLRDSDYLGYDHESNQLLLLLSNTSQEEAEFVVQRLRNMKLFSKVG